MKEVENFESDEFKQSIAIYESSFPSNEKRSSEKVTEMLQNNENYHLIISRNNETVIGISLMYAFSHLNIGFLDYMAVIPTYQRQGIGKKLFDFTLEKLSSVISNGIGLMMEIQRENVQDLQEVFLRKNRIKFYMNLGAKILDGADYLLPPLQYGIEPEEMYLLLRPFSEIHYLSKQSVIR
jgi:predicted N-acetyltransferase YhbS